MLVGITAYPPRATRGCRESAGLPARRRLGCAAALAAGLAGLSCGPLLEEQIERANPFSSLTPDRQFGVDPGPPRYEPRTFVNFESPHVSPLDLSEDGSLLLAVNTPDNRLELFDAGGELPVLLASIPVGLEPVSVRFRTPQEAWVANHLSDSVSIVNLPQRNVVRTLFTADEPTDVVFAAGRAFVVCSQANQVLVFELADLERPPAVLAVAGEDPRAAAVSPDGLTLYVAIFESGNRTTLAPEPAVSDPRGPYAGQNPPPKGAQPAWDGTALPPAPPAGLIVRRDVDAPVWRDENGADWSAFITWDVLDHDVAVIDALTLEVRYIRSLMNLNMHLAVRRDGLLAVVGTEALNEIRFEPELSGRFVRSMLALVSPSGAAQVLDLNPHLSEAYARGVSTLPPAQREASLADPRAIVWGTTGTVAFVAGMGSNNVALLDAEGRRLGQLDVGQGPTGLRLDEQRGRLYVLNRFDASLSVVDTSRLIELGRTRFFDPTPPEIRAGRPFLYDARRTSGLGVTACAACHVDGRMDHLAWDLGDPHAAVKPFDQECDPIVDLSNSPDAARALRCEDFHPLKGPMVTQTLQGIIGSEPLHWRGDRGGIEEFNAAFVGLNGAERLLTDGEMAQFRSFLATLTFPPNPYRRIDNSLGGKILGGDPRRGEQLFMTRLIDEPDPLLLQLDPLAAAFVAAHGPLVACHGCHQLPSGTNRRITPANLLAAPQSTKVPQLRNMHEKTGFFSTTSRENHRGFGFTRDGRFATLESFLRFERFVFGRGPVGEQRRRDVVAFVMSLATDTHAGVGQQVTLNGLNREAPAAHARLGQLRELADTGQVGLVAHGYFAGELRGFAYVGGGVFQSDRAGEWVAFEQLRDAAGQGSELTWTLVPLGSEIRLGIDRELDGVLDGDAPGLR